MALTATADKRLYDLGDAVADSINDKLGEKNAVEVFVDKMKHLGAEYDLSNKPDLRDAMNDPSKLSPDELEKAKQQLINTFNSKCDITSEQLYEEVKAKFNVKTKEIRTINS